MTSSIISQKYTHLFKILDFDHDGILQESDFLSVGENISIFRSLETGGELENFVMSRCAEIWNMLKLFLDKKELNYCNLEIWLKFLGQITDDVSPKVFDVMTQKTVKEIYHIFDHDMDDHISQHEFLCLFVSLRVRIKEADECFKMLDLDSDNLISRNELYLAIKEFFLSDDIDAPGNLLFGNSFSFSFKTRASRLHQ